MRGDTIGFAVATRNQASGRWDVETAGLWPDWESAVAERDHLAAETTAAGRGERHAICQVVLAEDAADELLPDPEPYREV